MLDKSFTITIMDLIKQTATASFPLKLPLRAIWHLTVKQ